MQVSSWRRACFDFGLTLPEPDYKESESLGLFKQAITHDDNWFIRPPTLPRNPHKKSPIEVSEKLIRKENVVLHTRAQIKIQLSPAWPQTIWPLNQILNQIIFSYGTFNPLLFYSLAVPRIYCGSAASLSLISAISQSVTHTHLDLIKERGRECLLAVSGIGTPWTAVPYLPWSFW